MWEPGGLGFHYVGTARPRAQKRQGTTIETPPHVKLGSGQGCTLSIRGAWEKIHQHQKRQSSSLPGLCGKNNKHSLRIDSIGLSSMGFRFKCELPA